MINLLVYLVSTIFTYVLGIIAKKNKWNEILPIPIQNIIVGIIVFTIFYIIYRPQNAEDVIQQIIVALGGTGTATLSYDISKINKEDK